MSTTTTPLAFVYRDGADVYVHPAEVRVVDANALSYAPDCIAECGVPFALGDVILYTDAHDEGHATAHLPCLLATGNAACLVTMEDAEEMQDGGDEVRAARHADPRTT